MKLRVRTRREVVAFTAALTAMAVMVPLATVLAAFGLAAPDAPWSYLLPRLIIAGLIPLLITPPIAYVILNLLRTQAEMIRMVDERIIFDMMTGLFNRNHFLDNMRASQANGPMMIVDADHFKSINDTRGHAVGDEALRILANGIKHCVGDSGTVGRLGGEEFGIFMPGKSVEEGHAMAEAVCMAVRKLHPLIAGKRVNLSVSIGCGYHRTTKVIGHSMKVADDLLYRAKAEGRDRAVYELETEAKRRKA